MRILDYRYIVYCSRKDFRSKRISSRTVSRKGFQTKEAAERYLKKCRSSDFCVTAWME